MVFFHSLNNLDHKSTDVSFRSLSSYLNFFYKINFMPEPFDFDQKTSAERILTLVSSPLFGKF